MYFIPENYTFIEAVLMLLTEPIVLFAGALALIATTLLMVHYLYSKPELSFSKIWTISLTLSFISGMLTSLIFALTTATFVDLDKGYYEATGTIESVEHRTQYAGETDGDYTIELKLDNGDLVDIQMPLQSPESIEPGDDFTLQSELIFNRYEVKDFAPIEKLHYLPKRQSLGSSQFPTPYFSVDLIVDGVAVK